MAAEAARVRALAVELTGGEDVAAELRQAVQALARACGIPAAQVFADSAPRSVRLGTRLAAAGARRAASRTRR